MRPVAAIVRPLRLLLALVVAVAVVSACGSDGSAPKVVPKAAPKATPTASPTMPPTADGAPLTTLSMQQSTAYTPRSINGGTDDYHCTLVDPHVTANSFIVSSQFFPGSGKPAAEVHHAILFLVPPELVKAAQKADSGGKGWTCFGEPPVLGGTGLKQFLSMPWLSAWAPGKGKDTLPATTGTPLPKGSLIVMQVHYNLLAGDLPVTPHVELDTVPASTNLRPTSIQPLVVIPNIPCPTGVTGPLCDRKAELADLSKRFGPYIPLFDAGVETFCGENPSNPPLSNTTSCTWPVRQAGYIIRAAPHMHLLGASLKITLNPGTPKAKTVLDVPAYDFNNQAAHNNTPWIKVAPGDRLQVSCTYNPRLAQELPQLRQIPSHFVTWGDGTSDEMCLGLAVEVPLDPHATVDWANPTGSNRVGQI